MSVCHGTIVAFTYGLLQAYSSARDVAIDANGTWHGGHVPPPLVLKGWAILSFGPTFSDRTEVLQKKKLFVPFTLSFNERSFLRQQRK